VAIILGGESIQRQSGRPEIRIRGHQHVKAATVKVQVDILELERGVIGCCAYILPRTQDEEEGDNNHIHNIPLIDGATCAVLLLRDISYDRNWNRFDS
jgi:hypothetical protein